MRAKFINEIKQEIEGSGLGAIGVGKAGMQKAYKYVKMKWPFKVEKARVVSEKFVGDQYKFLSRAEAKFGISLDEYIWVDKNVVLITVADSFDKWAGEIKWDKTLSINQSTWDKDDSRIVKYNYEWNIGSLYASTGLFDEHRISGYFLKYK